MSEEKREWDYCPTCSGELDTGFECLKCGLDWRQWAMAFENIIEAEVDHDS